MVETNDGDDSTWTFTISLGGDDNDDNNDDSTLLTPPPPHSTCSPKSCEDGDVPFPLQVPQVPHHVVESFRRDGFAVFPHVLSLSLVHDLNERLEEILRGRYDRGKKPDKTPKIIKSEYNNNHHQDSSGGSCSKSGKNKDSQQQHHHAVGPLGFSGNLKNVKVLQVINVHKSDRLFRKLVTHPALGKVVADLAGWGQQASAVKDDDGDDDDVRRGVRLAQDQVWAKPPGAPPLAFHRDSPYFMFTPNHVVTVWIALDDMEAELGPLEYVRGSHVWGDGRVGSANQFFSTDRGLSLLHSAAAREGISTSDGELDIVSMAGLKAGGISIHDGRTWHGSGRNNSKNRPRRGIGIHFVPAHVRFTPEAAKSRLWKHYVVAQEKGADDEVSSSSIDNDDDDDEYDVSKVELPDEDFPITWSPRQQR